MGLCFSIQGPSALMNNSETCYMNAMIQALASSDRLIKSYSDLYGIPGCTNTYKLFVDLLKSINKKNDIFKNTDKLKRLITNVKWDKESQQDTFQMLSFFINAIEKGMKDALKREIFMPPKFKIIHTFSENSKYNKIQSHLAVTVPLCGQFRERPGVELKQLLDAFFAPSEIDDGPNNTSMYLYDNAPDVLILHIQANEWSNDLGKYIKPKYYITYKELLTYEFTIHHDKNGSNSEKMNVEYRLMAVVHHMGSVEGGHYITYRKYHNEWYLTNDEQVEKVPFKCDVTPYVMVYEKSK